MNAEKPLDQEGPLTNSDDLTSRPQSTAPRRRSAGTAWWLRLLAFKVAQLETRVEKIEADLAALVAEVES